MIDLTPSINSLTPELTPYWEGMIASFRLMGSAVVAFSGGVDSGLLCAAAFYALREKMLAVTVSSPVESLGDVGSARALSGQVGFPLRVIEYDDLQNPLFVDNPPNRCYVCKLARFNLLKQLASIEGFAYLVEGSNADDVNDYRPGRQAVKETGAKSPLMDLGMGKKEIRALSKALGLNVWERPSAPCLATRFPYGSKVTYEGLRQVAKGEAYLQSLGFTNVRVRHHGTTARLEVEAEGIQRLAGLRLEIIKTFYLLGFKYVALDLAGYRSGSLNEEIK